jgi:hypothetical protein
MAIGKTTSWNVHKLPAYDRLKFYRAAREEARAAQQKMSNLAGTLTNIQRNEAQEMGNITSRIALKRMADAAKARADKIKLA